jgi:hypothetical protein
MPKNEDSGRNKGSKARDEARRLLNMIKAAPSRYDRRELARRALQMVQLAMRSDGDEDDRYRPGD